MYFLVSMVSLDIDLLAIESPFEYQERKVTSETVSELKRLIAFCDQVKVPVMAFTDILREPGMGDEWLIGQLGFSLDYIKKPKEGESEENDEWKESLLDLLKHTVKPQILLTGGYIRYVSKEEISLKIY
jgi:hypothetical protein